MERVEWIGEVLDPVSELARADLLVQPNFEPEPFGLVLAQAIREGVPVISTRQGGVPEWASDAGVGWIQPGDVEGLAEQLFRWIADEGERRRAGEQGRLWVRDLLHPQHYETAVLEELAAGV